MAYITIIAVVEVAHTKEELKDLDSDSLLDLGREQLVDEDAVKFISTFAGVHEMATEEGADI